MRLRRIVYLCLLTACIVLGQEVGAPGWDFRHDAPAPAWLLWVSRLSLAIAYVGLWKLQVWLLRLPGRNADWKRLRLWLPTGMLVWGWLTFAPLMFQLLPEPVGVWIVVPFVITNLPEVIPVALLFALTDRLHQPNWMNWTEASVLFWCGWLFTVRQLERTSPAKLH